jgi:hypothetical protein
MDFCVVAFITLNNTLFAFLIWVFPRSAVVLAVALGQAAFLLPSLWLSLEAGMAALVTAVLILFILVDVIVEVWPWLR